MRRYTIEVGGMSYTLDVDEITTDRYSVTVAGGATYDVRLVAEEGPAPARAAVAVVAPPVPPAVRAAAPVDRVAALRAPLPGAIVSVAVKPGDAVVRGQVLVTMETMKMQNPLRSPQDGVIAEVRVQAGQTVAHNDILVSYRDA